MAEILLSLTIIGVVAAITLPSLTGNINERTWNTQRKALYARFSQAIALMPALNGYGTVTQNESGSITADNATETFITAGLAKVLKINNICDSEHLPDCGFPDKITKLDNSGVVSLIPKTLYEFNNLFEEANHSTFHATFVNVVNTKAAAFETANGESILVYYNLACTNNKNSYHYAQGNMCANFVYDLNGRKGPNTVGKDIGFISAIYPSDSVVVAPMPAVRDAGNSLHANLGKICTLQNSAYRAPNLEELMAIFYNRILMGALQANYPSNTVTKDGRWIVNVSIGLCFLYSAASDYVRCVQR